MAETSPPRRVNGCVIALLLLPVGLIGTLAVGFEPVGRTAIALALAMFTARTWRAGVIEVPAVLDFRRERRPITFWSVVAFFLVLTLVASVAAVRAWEKALSG